MNAKPMIKMDKLIILFIFKFDDWNFVLVSNKQKRLEVSNVDNYDIYIFLK